MALALITFWCIVFWIDFPFPFYSFSLSFLGPGWLAGLALLLLSIHFACPFWAPSWLVCSYFLFIFPVFFGSELAGGSGSATTFYIHFSCLFPAPSWLVSLALPLLSIHFPFPFCGPRLAAGCGSPTTFYYFSLLFWLWLSIFFLFHLFKISIISDIFCTFWRSFCAGPLCFFERNLAISGARFVLASCAFLNETWRFLVLVLRLSLVLFWTKLGDFWCSFCAGLLCFLNETWRFLVLVLCWSLVLFWTKLGDFWCSFCAGLLCFFERNLAISGARFVLVSCAFLNETWRFLVLVLCWSLVLFWTKLGDFWCSFCARLLCFFERNLAISGARFVRFFERNLAISGARFVLVSCAFLNETWRFLVLVLCWPLVLFWTMDDQSRDQLRFDRKIFSKKSLQKHLDPGADFVLVNCAFFGSGWWPGPSLQYTSFHVYRISCWLPGPTFLSVFFNCSWFLRWSLVLF